MCVFPCLLGYLVISNSTKFQRDIIIADASIFDTQLPMNLPSLTHTTAPSSSKSVLPFLPPSRTTNTAGHDTTSGATSLSLVHPPSLPTPLSLLRTSSVSPLPSDLSPSPSPPASLSSTKGMAQSRSIDTYRPKCIYDPIGGPCR